MKKLLYILLFLVVGISLNAQPLKELAALRQTQLEVGCSSPAGELYSQDNAASICPEVDATTGWASGGEATVASIETDFYDGASSISIISTTTQYDHADFDITLEDAEDYTITMWAKRTVGNTATARIYNWTGFVTSPNQSITTSWAEYVFNVTANATACTIQVATNTASNGAIGDEILIDKISIIKVEQLYPIGNAASLSTRELDATTDWSTASGGSILSIETETEPDGTSVLEITADGTNYDRGEFSFTAVIDSSYQMLVSVLRKTGEGSKQRINSWTGVQKTPDVENWTVDVWNDLIINVKATGTTILTKWNAATEPSASGDKLYIDAISILKRTPMGNIFTQDNAASTVSEANTTTGWAIGNDATLVTDAVEFDDGAYSIETVSVTGSVASWVEYDFNVDNGSTYTITIRAKQGSQGTLQQTYLIGFDTQNKLNITTTSWATYTFTDVTANVQGTATLRLMAGQNSSTVAGDIVYGDTVIIEER